MPFNGINNLRDANESVQMEPWMLKELARCARDPLYFIKHYVYINTKDKGMQLFKLYDFQEELIIKFNKHRFNIIKFPRQCGKSATTRAFILWYALFNEDKVVAILGNKLNLAQEQLQQLRDSYINLPYWMQPGVKQWNKRGVQFSHGTRVICAATSPDGIRGMSINLLFLDEFAFIKSHIADEFIASVFPTISSGKTTKVIITSCVTKDTMVFTDSGIKEVSDFIIESNPHGGYTIPEYKVLGMRNELNTGYLMHNEGLTNTKIITTKYSTLECSHEHKLWACKNGEYGWFKSKELNEGDYISIKYGMNCWGNDKIDFIDESKDYKNANRLGDIEYLTPDLAYILGLYISEGNATDQNGRRHVDITCGDNIKSAITDVGLRYYIKNDNIHYQIGSTSLVLLLKHLGFDITRKAPQKIIPKRLMQLSKECTSAMLQGIFDGDGWTTKDRYRVGIKLSSKKLIEQIRILLLNYGILSTYNEGIIKPTKLVSATGYGYGIEITTYESVKLYFNEIGFRFNRKQSVLEMHDIPTRMGDKEDIIPFSVSEMRKFKKQHSITHDIISFTGEHKRNLHWSRTKMISIKNKLSDNLINNSIFDNVTNDTIWIPIKSITESTNYVYDFSLPDISNDNWCHSVIYNGIIGHNTPSGMNHFFRMWEEACTEDQIDVVASDETNGYVKSEIPWNAVPGRNAEWARDEMKKIGEIRFNQEYMCEFIGSVSTLIDHHFLKKLESKKPMKIPNLPEFIRIYEPPLKKEKLEAEGWEYAASLDSGYGVHQDSSVLQIFLIKSNITVHQVAVISSNKMDIDLFCKKCYVILKKYHDPALIIEQNGPGIAAMSFFYNTVEYENLLHFDPSGRHMGLWASEKTKQNACILFKSYIERRFMTINDRATINEMHSFGKVTQEHWGGLGGNHDDHITAAYWIPFYLQSAYYYGKVVEVNMKAMEEDEVILKTEEELAEERIALEKVRNSGVLMKEMENNAKYLSNNKPKKTKAEIADEAETGMVMFQR